MRYLHLLLILPLTLIACNSSKPKQDSTQYSSKDQPFRWENATVYFILTDRFNNGDPGNDQMLGRQSDGAKLRSFMGGDFAGITQKIEEGYFDHLGVNALWFTPPVEQISGYTDEGTGKTYAYHGYWARDWTAIDPNYGTLEELKALVKTAHEHGIRIMWDAVINHTGPVTGQDPAWPDEWVRLSPTCNFQNYDGTINCTLVDNLPDVFTDTEQEVAVPDFLLEKWEEEGRKEAELAELDAFFKRTGYPRTPRFYLIKWLTDWIRELGIDAYRIDTAKHTEADVWEDLKREAVIAFKEWQAANPGKLPEEVEFFMTGEVYGYGLGGGRDFGYGDTAVDFFQHGFESLINFGFKSDVRQEPEALFSQYATALNEGGALAGLSVLNYLTSHDDGSPYDVKRKHPMLAGTLLLLSPGSAQIYYGDETARPLEVLGANGDANLRSFMNWEDLDKNRTQEVLTHWQKLGQFRQAHLSVGMGRHQRISEEPYVFSRSYTEGSYEDQVVVAMNLKPQDQPYDIPVGSIFDDGFILLDYYSGQTAEVIDGKVSVDTDGELILLGLPAL